MKKWVLLVIVVVSVASVITYTYRNLSSMISKHLSTKIGVPLQIQGLNVHGNFFEIQGLEIKNPLEKHFEYAARVKNISIYGSYLNYLFKKTLVIDNLTLDDVYLSLELSRDNSTACNWEVIFKKMEENHSVSSSDGKTGLIKKLSFNHVTVDIKLYNKPIQTIHLSESIEFTNIDVVEGIPSREISKILAKNMIMSVFSLETVKSIVKLPWTAFKKLTSPLSKRENVCEEYYNELYSK